MMRTAIILGAVAWTATAVADDTPLVKKRRIEPRRAVTPSSVCTAKQPEDCVMLAMRFQYGAPGFTKDLAKAVAYNRIACDAEDDGGCSSLADMYFNGTGVKEDEAEGMRLLRLMCKRGSCMTLAFKLLDFDGKAERAEALKIFSSVCEGKGGGDEDDRGSACYMRADRSPVSESTPWYVKACQAGDERGCARVSNLYREDRFPGVTPTAATRALEAMCDKKFPPSCFDAAERHDAGKGVPANRTEGDKWLKKACDLGADQGCKMLARRKGG